MAIPPFEALLNSATRLENGVRYLRNQVDALMVQLDENPGNREVVQALANNIDDRTTGVQKETHELTGRLALHMGLHHPE